MLLLPRRRKDRRVHHPANDRAEEAGTGVTARGGLVLAKAKEAARRRRAEGEVASDRRGAHRLAAAGVNVTHAMCDELQLRPKRRGGGGGNRVVPEGGAVHSPAPNTPAAVAFTHVCFCVGNA